MGELLTTQFWVAVALFALFALAMLAVVLLVGPRRGTWNQPAAAYVAPGRGMRLAMYALATVHVLVGAVAALVLPGGGFAVFLVAVLMALFYVACGASTHLAALADRHRHRRDRMHHATRAG